MTDKTKSPAVLAHEPSNEKIIIEPSISQSRLIASFSGTVSEFRNHICRMTGTAEWIEKLKKQTITH